MRLSRAVPRAVPMMIRSGVAAATWSMRAAVCGETRRHTQVTPTEFQIAFVSSSTRGTRRAGMSVISVTVMTSGGSGEGVEAAAASDVARAAAERVVMRIAAIEGQNKQKFDVRKRYERTALNLEIDRNNVLRERCSVLRNRHVTVVCLVGVERCPIRERDHQRRIVRSRRPHHVLTNLQVDDPV